MTNNANPHPPIGGKKLAIVLDLSKRSEGVSQLESLEAGGGIRLAAQIGKLEGKGHRFHRQREGREGYMRYWWIGFDPAENSRQTFERQHRPKAKSACPPVPVPRQTTAPSKKGGNGDA